MWRMTDLKYLTFFGAEVVSGDGGEEGGNGDDPIIAQVMGWTSFAAYIPLLLPQILLHYRSQTTFGFSKFAVVCWHLGSLMYIAYTVYDAQPMHIMVIWLWYTTCSMVIVGQWMYYDADWISNRARVGWIVALFVVSAAATWLLVELYEFGDERGADWIPLVLGSFASGILVALGFLPQLVLMYRMRSSDGISLIFSCLDIIGSGSATLAILLARDPNIYLVVPHFGIVFFELSVIVTGIFVFPQAWVNRWRFGEGRGATPVVGITEEYSRSRRMSMSHSGGGGSWFLRKISEEVDTCGEDDELEDDEEEREREEDQAGSGVSSGLQAAEEGHLQSSSQEAQERSLSPGEVPSTELVPVAVLAHS